MCTCMYACEMCFRVTRQTEVWMYVCVHACMYVCITVWGFFLYDSSSWCIYVCMCTCMYVCANVWDFGFVRLVRQTEVSMWQTEVSIYVCVICAYMYQVCLYICVFCTCMYVCVRARHIFGTQPDVSDCLCERRCSGQDSCRRQCGSASCSYHDGCGSKIAVLVILGKVSQKVCMCMCMCIIYTYAYTYVYKYLCMYVYWVLVGHALIMTCHSVGAAMAVLVILGKVSKKVCMYVCAYVCMYA
jgi:hypothetical protein